MSISMSEIRLPQRCGINLAVAILGLGLGCIACVTTADAAVGDKVKKACKGDYQRLCPNYKVGSNQLRACMEAKQSDISWDCIQALIDSGEVDKQRAGSGRR